MAQTQEISVKIKTAIDAAPTIQAYKDLLKLQKGLVSGSEELKLVQQRMADIKDITKGAKEQNEDLVDSLGRVGGPIGMLARGYDTLTSSTNKFGLALKATGIGLLVALVGQLVVAFTSNEKAMKKLEPIMIGFEQILGGIFKVLEPVFDLFIDLAMKAMPYLQKAIGGLYTAFAALYSFFKNFIGTSIKLFSSFGKVLKGVFTLDWDMIKEGVSDGVNAVKEGIGNVVDDTKKTWNSFNDGLNETTKTQKKNLKEQGDDQKKFLDEQKARYESAEKARQADLDKAKAIALAGAKTEQEKLAIEKKYAEDIYNSKKKLLEDQAALYPKGSKEYNDYITQLTALDADYINKKTEFRNKDKEQEKKDFDESVKSAQDANKRKVDDLTTTYNLQKEKYGENSKEARKAQDAIFAAQAQGLEDEKKLYEGKKELTKEEKARLEDIIQAQKNLTTTVQVENEKRIKADIDALVKKNETEKAIRDKGFEDQLKGNQLNLEEQERILTAKKEADRLYYEQQELLLAGNVEKLNELNQKKLADATKLVEDEKLLEEKRLATKLKALDDIVAIAGAESNVGKAALVAKQLLLAKELFLEIQKTITFSTQAAARSVVAVAEGTAQTAKVGFPQNIPLLIGYAAQAVGIISAIMSAVKSAKGSVSSTDTGTQQNASGTAVPKPRGMATGGFVSGIGGPKSDLIPAMLSNGESVINAQSTSMFRPLLSSINEIGGGKRFAEGGLSVGSFSQNQALQQLQNSMNFQQAPIKTYVVASDMSNQQMMDRNIKTRSTL
jgi:hypothetical protein